MANPLLEALGFAGNVLDTPGSVVRGLLSGDAQRAFGGILDPSKRVSGRDMLDKWGITNNDSGALGDVGGFAAQIATDPLTWFGGSLAKGLLGRSGKLAPEAAEAAVASKAVPQASTLLEAAPGVHGYAKNAAGGIERIAPLEAQAKNAINASGVPTYAGRSTPLSEAEQWTGKRASFSGSDSIPTPTWLQQGPQATTLLESQSGAGGAGNVANLLDKRRQFTVAKDIGDTMEGQLTARTVGGYNAIEKGQTYGDRARQISDSLQNTAGAMRDSGGLLRGEYDPMGRVASIARGAPEGTTRHEIFHGLMEAARQGGDNAGLSPLAKLANHLQRNDTGALGTLGFLGEESLAHGVGSGRSVLDKLRGNVKFLANPNEHYIEQLERMSPLVSRIYGSAAIPRVGLGLAGAGGAGLLSALGAGRE